ncbi:MAG: transporter substrate-binding domain-containing protein [Candidatus ainarchaeum sp.]|nr:transporter substrate-binding domain-containing protein [Candidatus ainarchaeum sp.]
MKKLFLPVILIIAIVFLGCTQQSQNPSGPMPGSGSDEHGCIGSAGYFWCEAKQKCLRPWEELCISTGPGQMPGSDRDEHGCIGSAGYSWCETKQKCLRTWEEPCTSGDREAKAETYCSKPDVSQVSTCGPYIKVVSMLIGGGSTFYSDDGNETRCPVVGPDAMSEECRLLLTGSNCIEKIICDNTQARAGGIQIITEEHKPYNFADENGIATGQSTEIVREILKRLNQSAGIGILPWEEAYEKALTGPGIALYSTTRTRDRNALFKWAGPISNPEREDFYARKDSSLKLNVLEDAKKAGKICVIMDDSREQILSGNGFTNLDVSNNDLDCIQKLADGSVDLWVGNKVILDEITKENGIDANQFKPAGLYIISEFYIAFSSDVNSGTIVEWQSALDSMKQDGAYEDILAKYSIGN